MLQVRLETVIKTGTDSFTGFLYGIRVYAFLVIFTVYSLIIIFKDPLYRVLCAKNHWIFFVASALISAILLVSVSAFTTDQYDPRYLESLLQVAHAFFQISFWGIIFAEDSEFIQFMALFGYVSTLSHFSGHTYIVGGAGEGNFRVIEFLFFFPVFVPDIRCCGGIHIRIRHIFGSRDYYNSISCPLPRHTIPVDSYIKAHSTCSLHR